MNNEIRERVKKTFIEIQGKWTKFYTHCLESNIPMPEFDTYVSDELIAAGCVIPKFRIGQQVWINERNFPNTCFYPHKGIVVGVGNMDTCVRLDCGITNVFNNMVYATEIEAREALKRQ